eukprot:SAG31_NODE_3125_length_4647_cov_5.148417_4_plen_73_part_00
MQPHFPRGHRRERTPKMFVTSQSDHRDKILRASIFTLHEKASRQTSPLLSDKGKLKRREFMLCCPTIIVLLL